MFEKIWKALFRRPRDPQPGEIRGSRREPQEHQARVLSVSDGRVRYVLLSYVAGDQCESVPTSLPREIFLYLYPTVLEEGGS